MLNASGALWIGLVVIGLAQLVRYESTPGAAAGATTKWAGAPELALNANRTTLVMFVHPLCPCSRASLAELARLMTLRGKQIDSYVLFFKPTNASSDWDGALLDDAKSIPGVTVIFDENGKLASRFDAQTSGQTFLYEPSGRLTFSGGITAARGHVGDNASLDAVLALTHPVLSLRQSTASPVRKDVFGCPILGSQRGAGEVKP